MARTVVFNADEQHDFIRFPGQFRMFNSIEVIRALKLI